MPLVVYAMHVPGLLLGSSVIAGAKGSHRGFADVVQPTVPDTAVPLCRLIRSMLLRTLIQPRGALRRGGLPVSKCPLCSCSLTVGVLRELTPACSRFDLCSAVAPFRTHHAATTFTSPPRRRCLTS
jgi:hypothetical protein